MKHGHRFVMVALVAGMLAVALALPANPGLATISSCDPCTEGVTLLGPESFGRERGTPATGHRNFVMPADGDLCVLLTNNGCGAAEVKIDGEQIFSPGQLSPNVTELVSTIPLAQGDHTLSVRVASSEGCSVTVELRACALLCSQAATTWCEAKGWHVAYYWQGSIICTAPGYDEFAHCEECDTYNIVVYVDGAGEPLCPGGLCTTDAGYVYGGHVPCECGDNLRYCQPWDMQGCTPDP
jgi:hypothetical protein